MREDGVIQYEGRTDSQVKVRGHRVDLSEIQKHLLEIDGVEKAIVLCNTDEFGQTILAFVSTTTLVSPPSKFKKIVQFEDILRANLADYMIPQIIIVDEMPLLVNGKVDRQALLMMYSDLNNNGKCIPTISISLKNRLNSFYLTNFDLSFLSSESAIDYDFNGVSQCERQKAGALFETITEVIGRTSSAVANISLESNFYAMGGNSLNSIYTIAKLRERGYAIEIADFLSAGNLADILNCMVEIKENVSDIDSACEKNRNFIVEPLKMEHKSEAIQ